MNDQVTGEASGKGLNCNESHRSLRTVDSCDSNVIPQGMPERVIMHDI